MSRLNVVLALSGLFLLNACVTTAPAPAASSPAPAPAAAKLGPAQQRLADGIKSYDDGDLKGAAGALQGALDLGLGSSDDQVSAHKHLAFIHCVSKREKQCREEFKKALEINPGFELQPAEAGHPLWGSVFRREKARYAKQAK